MIKLAEPRGVTRGTTTTAGIAAGKSLPEISWNKQTDRQTKVVKKILWHMYHVSIHMSL